MPITKKQIDALFGPAAADRGTSAKVDSRCRNWGTERELEFIDELGRQGDSVHERRELLLGYLGAYPLRVAWGMVDAVAVGEYALRALAAYGPGAVAEVPGAIERAAAALAEWRPKSGLSLPEAAGTWPFSGADHDQP